jgi:hypothetical protein
MYPGKSPVIPLFGMRSTDVERMSTRTSGPWKIALAEAVCRAVGECNEAETHSSTRDEGIP